MIGATISHYSAALNPLSKRNLPRSGIPPLCGILGSGTRKRDKIFEKPRQKDASPPAVWRGGQVGESGMGVGPQGPRP
jgi:hypothetical protein